MIRWFSVFALVLTSLPVLAQPLPSLQAAARSAGASERTAASLASAMMAPVQEAELHAGDPAGGANFGYSVALTENRAVIGVPFDATLGVNAGAAYVFIRSGDTWTQEAKLLAPNGAAQHRFGWSVAISDDRTGVRIVVGAPLAEQAYIYERPQGTWSHRANLFADDRAANDLFGYAVSTSIERVLVGAPSRDVTETDSGAAYLFTRPSVSVLYQQRTRFIGTERLPGDRFGASVTINGDFAVVGAPGDDDPGVDSGALYLFSGISDFTNVGLSVFRPRTASLRAGDALGTSVALQGGPTYGRSRIVAGATGRDHDALSVGSAFVFELADRVVVSEAEIRAADGRAGDAFGSSVALADSVIAVGTGRSLAPSQTGVAYVFARDGSGWQQAAAVQSSDEMPGDRFGGAVALGGGRLLVGASWTSDTSVRSGSAYVFGSLRPVAGETQAPDARGGLTLSPPVPNPTAEQATLTLHVDRPQSVRAVIVDVTGREVAVLFDGVVAGEARLDARTAALAPGVYTVRVVGAASTVGQRVTVSR